MVCAACDNSAGTMIDVHLKDRFDTEDFIQGRNQARANVWVYVGDYKMPGELQLFAAEDGKPSFAVRVHHKRCAPSALKAVQDAATAKANRPESPTFQVKWRLSFNQHRGRIALLRAGFLMMFRQFGYSYILNPGLNRVREQILKPDEKIIPGAIAVDLGEAGPPANSVAIITSPPEHRAYFVTMRLVSKKSGRAVLKGVVMPGLGDDRDAIYERMHDAEQTGQPFHARFTSIKYDADLLSRPEAVMLPYEIWKELAT
jgi:hypothetical protein